MAALLYQRNTQLLHLLQQGKLLGIALDLRHMLRVFFQQHGTGIGDGVYRVTQTVDLTGAVTGLTVQQLVEVILDGAVIMGIHIFLDILEHLHHLGVGAAVERTLQGAYGAGDGAVGIGTAGGHGAADEGGVVAAAVLGVDHQHHIQQMGFLLGVLFVGTYHPQEVFRRGQIILREMDVQGIPLEIVALHRVGVGHDRGEAAHQLDGLQQHVFHRGVVGIIVIGVQRQHAAGQLVHDVPAGMAHDHVLGKALRQFPGPLHDLVEVLQLRPGGQIAQQQQIGHLLKAKGTGLAVGLNNFVEFNAAIVQPARHGDPLAVLNEIALYAAHL